MIDRSIDAWDSFWRYDRLSSFHAKPGAPNYGPSVADGWNAFFARLPAGARVLDLATGNGAIAVLAVAAGRDFAVTGADLAAVEPGTFVTRNRAELARIDFLARTPAEALPLPDANMDAIVSQYGIEYSDLDRSLPEAARVLGPGGRLRFACHAVEGSIARETTASIADADFLIDLDLVALAGRSTPAFNAGLKRIADRARTATDILMFANVHQSLCDAHDHDRPALSATADHLAGEVAAHRQRQAALLAAARNRAQMEEIGGVLETLGLDTIVYDEQRDGTDLIGHVIEARRA